MNMTTNTRPPAWPPERVQDLCNRINQPLAHIAASIGCDVAALRDWRSGRHAPSVKAYILRLEELARLHVALRRDRDLDEEDRALCSPDEDQRPDA